MRGTGRGRSHDFFGGNSQAKRGQKAETSSSETRTRDAAAPKPSMLLSRPRDEEKRPAVAIASRGEAEHKDRQRVQQVPKVLSSPREAPSEREMFDSRRLINDGMMFEETIMEYLTENPHFTVTAAIGPQTVGKSTILSMLAGNSPQDKYRYYVFRPASREAVESSRYQTTKIHVYVSKSRGIFLDCQGTNSSSLVEDSYRHSRKSDERSETTAYVECLQLVAFLLQVSNTILVCSDYTVDMEMVKILRTAEMLRANLNHASNLPQLNYTRKTNIVFVHVRANSVDFAYEVQKGRIQLIRRLFADSLRLRVSENDDSVLFLLSVLKPRKDTTSQLHSHHHQKERVLEAEECEKFEEGIRKMRFQLAAMPLDPFSEQLFTEKHWLLLARYIWKEAAFTNAVEKLANFFG